MKQSTQNFIKKNSKKYVNVSSPAEDVNLTQVTDIAVEDNVFKYSVDGGETYESAPIPTTADLENLGSDKVAPYSREKYNFKITVPDSTTISNTVIPVDTNVVIFWGDGENTVAKPSDNSHSYSHTYTSAGTYFITYYLSSEYGYISVLSGILVGYSYNDYVVDVRIPDGVRILTGFSGIKERGTLEIPESVTTIGENELDGNYFDKVVIKGKPSVVAPFRGWTYLKEIIGLENLTGAVGNLTFYNCTSLEHIELTTNFTSLLGTFYGNTALKTVFIPSTVTSIAAETFKNANPDAVIYCEASSLPVGWNADWNVYSGTSRLTVKWGYTREQYRTKINDGLISADIVNSRSTAQDKAYSANYINNNFVPITFASRLYMHQTSATTATLENEKPTLSNINYLRATTTNTDFDWTTPQFSVTRTLGSEVVLNATNSFAIDLYFSPARNATLSFGARIKISTDNGTTWETISTNQNFAGKTYNTSLNVEDFVVYTDALTTETTYPVGVLLKIEVFTKQLSATSLTTDYYCGVDIDGAGVYSFVEFNFANTNINTEQIEDGAVTKAKLSQGVQDEIDNAVKSISLSGGTPITPTNGNVDIPLAGDTQITARTTGRPIDASSLNFAVKSALTDANHLTMTSAEQTTAQSVLGVTDAINTAIANAITTTLNTPV